MPGRRQNGTEVVGGVNGLSGRELRALEQAAAHQARALGLWREVRDPARRLGSARRHRLLVEALTHVLQARGLLQSARQMAVGDASVGATLDAHVARLEPILAGLERLLARDGNAGRQTP